ncbi:DUF397 domain-containing protein [Streptomyces sp. NPDC101234]|uniref:DUF397 domain-containing protein n=1 Tax=Streptomyces sp. NPDC101234 TaxID=3366138 RepID=UPI0038003B8B
MTTPPAHRWFKSSFSGGSGTECIECTHAGNDTLLRDSKQGDGPIMTVASHAWRSFIESLHRGDFHD